MMTLKLNLSNALLFGGFFLHRLIQARKVTLHFQSPK